MKNNKKLAKTILIISIITTLGGCAAIDKHLYSPAASHARVDPLFRTAECKHYRAADGAHWGTSLIEGSTRNINSVFIKDSCDYQSNSINDFINNPNNPDYEAQYFDSCKKSQTTQDINNQEEIKTLEIKLITEKSQLEIDKNEADASLLQANKDRTEADTAKAKADKDKKSTSRSLANKLNTQANESKAIAEINKEKYQRSQLKEKATDLEYNTRLKIISNATQGSSISCLKYLAGKSDEICDVHKSHIYGNRAATNTTLQVLATGAGIAGAMTGVGAAAPLLSGSAGFLTGAQAIMDKEIYLNTVTQAVIQEIKTNRENFLNTKLADYEKSSRPIFIGEIRADAIDYHNKCSFYDGLLSLINEAGDKKPEQSSPALDRVISQKSQVNAKVTQVKSELSTITDPNTKTLKEAELKNLENELKTIDVIIASITAPKVDEKQK